MPSEKKRKKMGGGKAPKGGGGGAEAGAFGNDPMGAKIKTPKSPWNKN